MDVRRPVLVSTRWLLQCWHLSDEVILSTRALYPYYRSGLYWERINYNRWSEVPFINAQDSTEDSPISSPNKIKTKLVLFVKRFPRSDLLFICRIWFSSQIRVLVSTYISKQRHLSHNLTSTGYSISARKHARTDTWKTWRQILENMIRWNRPLNNLTKKNMNWTIYTSKLWKVSTQNWLQRNHHSGHREEIINTSFSVLL